MKSHLLLSSAFIALASQVGAGERQVNLSVPGMNCPSCPFIVQAAIESVDGVASVTADAEERVAVVIYDDAVATLEQITSASLKAGYEATVIESES